jgi:excinuclease UvrABC nuclease subunit
MIELAIPEAQSDLDQALEAIPNRPAVFLLWPREGKPYLSRTNVFQTRLKRLLGTRETPSRALHLRGTAQRLEYQLTGSRLEAQFRVWELARVHLGASYREAIRLRLPPYVKLVLSNQFPRTVVTAHIGRAPAVYFGPFRNRASAARFESCFLDLFQLRRCQEDLEPGPAHPGCIYGEMGRCLRPCQQAVGVEEYTGEAERVAAFLRTGGQSLVSIAESARERMSADMDFEGAALMHQRCQRIAEVLSLRDEMAHELNHLNAIAVVPSAEADAVELGWLRRGNWQGFSRIAFAAADARSVSLDARLRDLALAVQQRPATPVERMEQLAILARWFYASWRDGELLLFDDWEKIPMRKLVNAVSRTAHGQPPIRPSIHS